jgi:hypothetical protein
MGRTRFSGPVKSTGGFEIGVAADGMTAETNTIIIDSDGALYQAGTEITATAGELNRVADKSASVVDETTATLTLTAALHGDRTVTVNRAAGVTVTLPAATGTGIRYTIIIGTTATSNANIVEVANATDVMNGSLNIQQDTDADGTLKCWMAEVGDDTMTFAGAATTGGIVGNRIECIDYAAGFWSCTAWTISGGGSEVTPFSAAVS